MSISYQAKDQGVFGRQLKVQKISVPFTITANATPASKSIAVDEPAILFLRVEGIDKISTSTGALQASESLPSGGVTLSDASGNFIALALIQENLAKVVSVKVCGRGSSDLLKSCEVLGFTTGGASPGQSVVCNVRTGVDLSSTSLDAVLEIEYIVAE